MDMVVTCYAIFISNFHLWWSTKIYYTSKSRWLGWTRNVLLVCVCVCQFLFNIRPILNFFCFFFLRVLNSPYIFQLSVLKCTHCRCFIVISKKKCLCCSFFLFFLNSLFCTHILVNLMKNLLAFCALNRAVFLNVIVSPITFLSFLEI